MTVDTVEPITPIAMFVTMTLARVAPVYPAMTGAANEAKVPPIATERIVLQKRALLLEVF